MKPTKPNAKNNGTESTDKEVAGDLRARLASINKAFEKKYEGAGRFTNEKDLDIPLFSTGIFSLDYALTGGLPKGKLIEFFGPELSGKSLLAHVCVAETQKRLKAEGKDKYCVWFDVEQSYNAKWAKELGVDVDRVIVANNAVCEEIMDMIEQYSKSGGIELIVIDSIAAMMTKAEQEDEMGAMKYAPLAGALTRTLKKVVPGMNQSMTTVIAINQVREDLGAFVPTWKTPGGMALKHFSSTRVYVKKAPSSKLIKEGNEVTGLDIDCTVMKHRIGRNFTQATFRLFYNLGVDKIYDLVNFLVQAGQITQNGPMYQFKEVKFMGMAKFLEAVKTNQALVNDMYSTAVNLLEDAKKGGILNVTAGSEDPANVEG
jgi:recombination protein RecA